MERSSKSKHKKPTSTACDLPGWQRLVSERRCGASKGKFDIYYLSPENVKFRSKVTLAKHFGSSRDLSCFDYRTGKMTSEPAGASKTDLKRKRVHNTAKNLLALHKASKTKTLTVEKSPEVVPSEKKKRKTSFPVASHHSSSSDSSTGSDAPAKRPKIIMKLERVDTKPCKDEIKHEELKAVEKLCSPKPTSDSPAGVINFDDVFSAIISTLHLENGFDLDENLTVDEIIMKLAERVDDDGNSVLSSNLDCDLKIVTEEDVAVQQQRIDKCHGKLNVAHERS